MARTNGPPRRQHGSTLIIQFGTAAPMPRACVSGAQLGWGGMIGSEPPAVVTCEYVESRQGRREVTTCRSDLVPPTKLNKTKGGTLGSQSSSGEHSKMSPNLNARGLGLGGTPLTCRGRHRVSAVAVIGHSRRRNVEVCTSDALQRLVLHRPVPPAGVAKFNSGCFSAKFDGAARAAGTQRTTQTPTN